jgi:hypothetical protein
MLVVHLETKGKAEDRTPAWKLYLAHSSSMLMDEQTSLEQIAILRRMTPERRLALAEGLYWTAREMKKGWLVAGCAPKEVVRPGGTPDFRRPVRTDSVLPPPARCAGLTNWSVIDTLRTPCVFQGIVFQATSFQKIFASKRAPAAD